MFVWEDSLSTGVDSIDEQHKWLINKINELLEAITQGKGEAYHKTGELLDSLIFYAKWHFEREENCMEQYACPAAEINKERHQYFLNKIQGLYDRYHTEKMADEFAATLVQELGEWFIQHITKVDTQLGQCANIHQANQTSSPFPEND